MIEIKNLTKRFNEVIAVNDLSLEIHQGVNGLVGRNGAGKSTLLRLIADVYKKDNGIIKISGLDNYTKEAKEKVYFLSDDPLYSNNDNPIQLFNFYNSLFDFDKEKFINLLDTFGLPKERRISTYSKGMRRQLFIALTLSNNAEYLLMDEAFDGLDPLVLDSIKEEIIKASETKTIVVSSHNLASLEKLCSNFIILSKGKLKKNGEMEDLAQNICKYQVIFKTKVSEADLIKSGIDVIKYEEVGSIIHIITNGDFEDELKEKYDPTLLENIGISEEEIFKVNMMMEDKK